MLSSKQLTLVQSVPKENRPCHIGVIMDGNGRWAEKKKLPQGQGHRAGGQAIEKIIDACLLFEIPVLTLYAFSTENWNRPQSEVTNLMQILREYIEKHASKVIEKDIRFRTLGDISVLDADIYKNLSIIEKKSKNKKKMTLCLARKKLIIWRKKFNNLWPAKLILEEFHNALLENFLCVKTQEYSKRMTQKKKATKPMKN